MLETWVAHVGERGDEWRLGTGWKADSEWSVYSLSITLALDPSFLVEPWAPGTWCAVLSVRGLYARLPRLLLPLVRLPTGLSRVPFAHYAHF